MIEKQLLTAVIVPVGILVVTVVCKCLIRMSWPRLTDFYMGIDAMMAAIASGLIYLCDLGYQYRDAKKTVDPKDRADQLDLIAKHAFYGIGYCVAVAVFLFFLLLFHQRYEALKLQGKTPKFWSWMNFLILVICNGIGFGWLFAIVYFITG